MLASNRLKQLCSIVFGLVLTGANAIARQPVSPFNQLAPFSEPLPQDNFLVFLENLTSVTNIFQLEAQGLTQGRPALEPWAGSYWPIHQGVLGLRFADRGFPRSKQFIENYSYIQSRPAGLLVASGEVNKLSPSEKYDLLIGDSDWSLTRFMWNKGLDGFMRDGFVAGWTGICHGWSGVSHMGIPAAEKSVTVTGVTGHRITFYPQDIKGLQSWLWADSAPSTLRAGDRCRQSVVDRDPFLRPVDPACLDSNPATWHLAITNKIGLHQQSFAVDISAGTEVWNYPVTSYDYSYFNPRTFMSSHSLKPSIEAIANLKGDKYAAYRHPNAKYVVGIAMDVFHAGLISPHVGTSKSNVYQTKPFIYDLELDENFNIIGGEWYSKDRPDFLWAYPVGSMAGNREDSLLEGATWSTSESLPLEFAERARTAASRGKVLNKIANVLLAASAKTPVTDGDSEPIVEDEPIATNPPPPADNNNPPTEDPVTPPVVPPVEPPVAPVDPPVEDPVTPPVEPPVEPPVTPVDPPTEPPPVIG